MHEAFEFLTLKAFDRFFILGLLIFIIGLIFFLKYFIRSIVISIQRILHPLPWYSEKLLRKYLLSLLFLMIMLIGLLWMYVGIKLQEYQPIENVAIAGKVEIKMGASGEFMATFIPSYENFPQQKITRIMRENQWALGGAFIIFPKWLKYIGLISSHQPLDFVSKKVTEIYKPANDYFDQLNNKPDKVWYYLSKIQKLLDMKVADFRLTAFIQAKDGNYEIHATSGGYMITKIGKKLKQ